MQYQIELDENQYTKLIQLLETARQVELAAIKDITDSSAFTGASSIRKIQDSLEAQHDAPQPTGVTYLERFFQDAFDKQDT